MQLHTEYATWQALAMKSQVELTWPTHFTFSSTRSGIKKPPVLSLDPQIRLVKFILLCHNGYHSGHAIGAKWSQQKLTHEGTFQAERSP